MPFFRLGWRVVVPVVLVFSLVNVGAIKFVRDAYPSDPFRSEALAKCIAADPGFIRFIPIDRDRCCSRGCRGFSVLTGPSSKETEALAAAWVRAPD